APPTILESDLLSIPAGGKWRTESEEAYSKYQQAQLAAAPEPVAVPAERRPGLLGRLGLGRGGRGPSTSDHGAGSARGPTANEPVPASSRQPNRPAGTPATPEARPSSAEELAPSAPPAQPE